MSIVDDFSIKIYEPPLSDIRESGLITDLSNPVNILMLVLDFVTEVEINGIVNFIGNSTGIYAVETIDALRQVGRQIDAELLAQIIYVATSAGMTRDEIQKDMAGLEQYAVTTFAELHGDKWDEACELINQLDDQISYDGIYTAIEEYGKKHEDLITAVMRLKT